MDYSFIEEKIIDIMLDDYRINRRLIRRYSSTFFVVLFLSFLSQKVEFQNINVWGITLSENTSMYIILLSPFLLTYLYYNLKTLATANRFYDYNLNSIYHGLGGNNPLIRVFPINSLSEWISHIFWTQVSSSTSFVKNFDNDSRISQDSKDTLHNDISTEKMFANITTIFIELYNDKQKKYPEVSSFSKYTAGLFSVMEIVFNKYHFKDLILLLSIFVTMIISVMATCLYWIIPFYLLCVIISSVVFLILVEDKKTFNPQNKIIEQIRLGKYSASKKTLATPVSPTKPLSAESGDSDLKDK